MYFAGSSSTLRHRTGGAGPPDAAETPYYNGRMGSRRSIVDGKREEINALVRRHHGHAVSLFGSVARGDDTADSDIDFLVEFDAGSSLFDLMDLQEARRFTRSDTPVGGEYILPDEWRTLKK